jgi:hypothetical protein
MSLSKRDMWFVIIVGVAMLVGAFFGDVLQLTPGLVALAVLMTYATYSVLRGIDEIREENRYLKEHLASIEQTVEKISLDRQ